MTNAPLMLRSRPADTVVRQHFTVTGVVQGVGFRPFVHRIASELGLTGFVGNDSGAVFLEVQGEHVRVARIRSSAARRGPATGADQRRLRALTWQQTPHGTEFRIVASQTTPVRRAQTPIPPDIAVCDALCGRAVRPAQPPLPPSVHDLHQLRAAVHHHPRSCRTTAPPPPCRRSPCVSDALPNTTIRRIADSTHSRSPARIAVRRCGSRSRGAGRRNRRRAGRDPTGAGGAGAVVAIKGIGGYHLACCRRRRGGRRCATRTKDAGRQALRHAGS